MLRNAIDDANENLAAAFTRVADHVEDGTVREFGTVTAVSSGLQAPMFNPVFVFQTPDREDLADAVAWMRDRDAPFQVKVADGALAAVDAFADDLGVAATDDPQPGMVLASLEDVPEPDETVDVEHVTDDAGLDDVVEVSGDAFGMPPALARESMPASLLDDESMQLVLARVDGEPVASGLLVQHADVAGVYTIAVRESFRRRGLGTAVTWAVLRAGRDAGAVVGTLQSSKLGYSVYEAMGFETVVEYHLFEDATGGDAAA